MMMATIFCNPLITPNIGLMFWTWLIFLSLLIVLRKFAWKPIIGGIKAREESISSALNEAKKAREDMQNLKNENEQILTQARQERDKILKEAKEIKDNIVSEAKTQAQEEGKRIMTAAHEAIEKEKQAAFRELKEQVAILAIDGATRILKRELKETPLQEDLVGTYLNEVSKN